MSGSSPTKAAAGQSEEELADYAEEDYNEEYEEGYAEGEEGEEQGRGSFFN
jgi:flagellar biosynthesis/type III secretory pathway protein FliH